MISTISEARDAMGINESGPRHLLSWINVEFAPELGEDIQALEPGVRGHSRWCPLAQTLHKYVRGLVDVSVTSHRIWLRWDDGREELLELPPPIEAFVYRFENGEFPRLEGW